MKRIYFDVGANNGESLLQLAHESPDNHVYGFEPVPTMANIIREKILNLPNYHLIQKAVSDYNGEATFHVSTRCDWGCSSLNTFSPNLDKTWPGRTDFVFSYDITVPVIRLDTFLREEGITEIDHLHVDAQGSDMEVLFGLGDYIQNVKSGVIEMPTSMQNRLYNEQKYTEADAIKFLKEKGFQISRIDSNDVHRNEVNISFTR